MSYSTLLMDIDIIYLEEKRWKCRWTISTLHSTRSLWHIYHTSLFLMRHVYRITSVSKKLFTLLRDSSLTSAFFFVVETRVHVNTYLYVHNTGYRHYDASHWIMVIWNSLFWFISRKRQLDEYQRSFYNAWNILPFFSFRFLSFFSGSKHNEYFNFLIER